MKYHLKNLAWSVNPFSLQEFEVDNTKKYAQLILNFFWVAYMITLNPDIGKRVFGCSPHLGGLRLINYRAI